MSFTIRTSKDGNRSTVLVEKDGSVIELRSGNRTFPYGRQGAQRSWDSVDDWISSENLDRGALVYSKSLVSSDSQKVIDIMATFLRKPNMYKSADSLNGYKYAVDSCVYVLEHGRLIPFYIASDGTMLYKYTKATSFAELELVDPEFWVKDRGNQIIRFVQPL
jgi:hypothetical protein